jgi:hypothetical protein
MVLRYATRRDSTNQPGGPLAARVCRVLRKTPDLVLQAPVQRQDACDNGAWQAVNSGVGIAADSQSGTAVQSEAKAKGQVRTGSRARRSGARVRSGRASVLSEWSISPPTQKARAAAEACSKKSHYRPLPKEFCHDGFTFRQITREGDAAIYEQTWKGCQNPRVAYEVIRIRRREGFQIGGRFVERAEVYPNSEAWGTDGLTVGHKDAAFAKLRELA